MRTSSSESDRDVNKKSHKSSKKSKKDLDDRDKKRRSRRGSRSPSSEDRSRRSKNRKIKHKSRSPSSSSSSSLDERDKKRRKRSRSRRDRSPSYDERRREEKREKKKSKKDDFNTKLKQERRKNRRYDDDLDEMKEKEIEKRNQAEKKRKREEEDRKKEELKLKEAQKPKERELTEEEKKEIVRQRRLAKARVVGLLDREEEKKNEEFNLEDGGLVEEFLTTNDNDKMQEDSKVEKREEVFITFENKKLPQLPKELRSVEPILKKEAEIKKEEPPQQAIEEDEDPLDAFMKTIEKDATMQDYQIYQAMYNQELQKQYDERADKSDRYDAYSRLRKDSDHVKMIEDNPDEEIADETKIITLEDILNNKFMDNNILQPIEDDIVMEKTETQPEKEEEFHKNFIETLKNTKAPDLDPLYGYSEEKKEDVMYQEDVNEYLKEEVFQNTEELWMKAKSKGERKELKLVNHSLIKYEPFRKNLYIESKEVTNMSDEMVQAYRKEHSDIKVRGKKIPRPIFSWYHCGLSERILSILEKKGFKEPFPIQAQAIPCIMSGRDVIGIAETGSGKTLAYVLPMLRHVLDQRPLKVIILLINNYI
jgi:ATP-dependent RNA helicase DDX46/PRP5